MVREPAAGLADPDPQPAERLRPELADDRAQAVVATRTAALAEPELSEGQGEVVDHDEHLAERRALARQGLPDGEARLVHERLRLHKQEIEPAVPPIDDRGRVPIPPTAGPAGTVRDPVEDHPADVVPRLAVLLAGVPQPDDDLVDGATSRSRGAPGRRFRTRRTAPERGSGARANGSPDGSGQPSGGARSRCSSVRIAASLLGRRVIPAAEVEGAMRHQESQLVPRRPSDVARLPDHGPRRPALPTARPRWRCHRCAPVLVARARTFAQRFAPWELGRTD